MSEPVTKKILYEIPFTSLHTLGIRVIITSVCFARVDGKAVVAGHLS